MPCGCGSGRLAEAGGLGEAAGGLGVCGGNEEGKQVHRGSFGWAGTPPRAGLLRERGTGQP